MKKLHYIFASILAACNFCNIEAKLNEFGISDIIPLNISFIDDNLTFSERIKEEMGEDLDLRAEIIINFLQKIEIYFNHLLDNQNNDPNALIIAKLAIIDVVKAKKMLKIENVDANSEHELRIALARLDEKINHYK